MTKDAARFGGGINFYEYANDDPVNSKDRSGRDGEAAVASFGGGFAGLGALLSRVAVWLSTPSVVAGSGVAGGGAVIGGGILAGGLFISDGKDDPTKDAEGPEEGGVCPNSDASDPEEDCENIGPTTPQLSPYDCEYRCADGTTFTVGKNMHSESGCDKFEKRKNANGIQM